MRREWESLVINNKVKARIVLGRSSDFFYYSLNRYTSSNNLDSAVVHAALISGSVSTSLFHGFDLVSLFFIVIPGVTTWPNKVRYTCMYV